MGIVVVEVWVYGLAWWRVWVCGDRHLCWTLSFVVEHGGNGLWSRFVFAVWFTVMVDDGCGLNRFGVVSVW